MPFVTSRTPLRSLLSVTMGILLTSPLFGLNLESPVATTWRPSPGWTVTAVTTTQNHNFAAGQATDASIDLPAGFGFAGGQGDAFFVCLSPDSTVETGGYIGGEGNDLATDIAVSPNGQIAVVGRTDSPDFPVTPGAPFEGAGFIVVFSSTGQLKYGARFPLTNGESPRTASDGNAGFIAAFPGNESSLLIRAQALGQDWRATIGSAPGRVTKLAALGEFGYALCDLGNATRLQEYRLTDFGGDRVGWRDYLAARSIGVNPFRGEIAVSGPAGSLAAPSANNFFPGAGTNGGEEADLGTIPSPIGPPPPPPGGGNRLIKPGPEGTQMRVRVSPDYIFASPDGRWRILGGGSLFEPETNSVYYLGEGIRSASGGPGGLAFSQGQEASFLSFSKVITKGILDAKSR